MYTTRALERSTGYSLASPLEEMMEVNNNLYDSREKGGGRRREQSRKGT